MEFTPGSVHSASVTFSNPKSAGFDYQAALCMGAAWTEMARASFHLDAGQSKPISFSVTMPTTPETYAVYFKVWCAGVLIGTFVAAEPVVITLPPAFVDIVSISGPYYDGWPLHDPRLPEGVVEFAYDITYRIDNQPVYNPIDYLSTEISVLLAITDANGVGADSQGWPPGSMPVASGDVGQWTYRLYPNSLCGEMKYCGIRYSRFPGDTEPHWVQLEYVLGVWTWVPGPFYVTPPPAPVPGVTVPLYRVTFTDGSSGIYTWEVVADIIENDPYSIVSIEEL